MAVQVGSLGEAFPTGGALVRTHLLVHQLVARQVAGVVEAFPADVTDEGLVEVGHPVSFQHADAGVAFPTDVAMAAFISGVSSFNVQVTMSLVVEPLGTVVAGVWQQPVLSALVFAKPQDPGEQHAAQRTHGVTLPLVVREALRDWEQHPAAGALVSFCIRFLPPLFAAASCRDSTRPIGGRAGLWGGGSSVPVVRKVWLGGRRGGAGFTCCIREANTQSTAISLGQV